MRIRLPFEPLAAECVRVWRPESETQLQSGTVGKVAAVLGVDRRTVQSWADRGLVAASADRAASQLGVHPASIWPDEWDAVLAAPPTRRAAALERKAARAERAA